MNGEEVVCACGYVVLTSYVLSFTQDGMCGEMTHEFDRCYIERRQP